MNKLVFQTLINPDSRIWGVSYQERSSCCCCCSCCSECLYKARALAAGTPFALAPYSRPKAHTSECPGNFSSPQRWQWSQWYAPRTLTPRSLTAMLRGWKILHAFASTCREISASWPGPAALAASLPPLLLWSVHIAFQTLFPASITQELKRITDSCSRASAGVWQASSWSYQPK